MEKIVALQLWEFNSLELSEDSCVFVTTTIRSH
jgi:hypothetical protein